MSCLTELGRGVETGRPSQKNRGAQKVGLGLILALIRMQIAIVIYDFFLPQTHSIFYNLSFNKII
jgi:hypothetical protein